MAAIEVGNSNLFSLPGCPTLILNGENRKRVAKIDHSPVAPTSLGLYASQVAWLRLK